ncbi:MAG: Acyltransferase [Parcubacteria group bacterium ADurb.Bin326]|nr:MAG: Acyltransferase [Parcubacteria group bacterium ADurb.Bin326]
MIGEKNQGNERFPISPEDASGTESYQSDQIESSEVLESDSPEDVVEQIEATRKKIDSIKQGPSTDFSNGESLSRKISDYQSRYLPDYLKKEKSLVSNLFLDLWSGSVRFELRNKENIPESGPFVVVCNHFGNGDVQALLKTFKDFNPHPIIGKSIWWKNSFFARSFLKAIKAIPVQESLSNLSKEEKYAAKERQGIVGKKVFQEISAQEDRGGLRVDTDFVRQSVAVLSRGDAMCLFPEGLWLQPQSLTQEKPEMKQAYRGLELVASQYEKLTGKQLPILPTSFFEESGRGKILKVGEAVTFDENNSELNNTDWLMTQIAQMLPENNRGYYKNSI